MSSNEYYEWSERYLNSRASDNIIDGSNLNFGTSVITTDSTPDEFDTILADASNQSVSVTLPSPSTNVEVRVKKIDSTGNTINIETPNSETIDGKSSLSISNQYTSRTIVSDGDNYFII